MKTLSFWRKSIYSAVIFFGTLMVLSIGYATLFWGLTAADKVNTGSGLTATAWNRIIDGVLDINTRLENLSFSGGRVGIGTTNPGAKLEVAGDIFINGNNVPYKKLVSCNGATYIQVAALRPTTMNAVWSSACGNACATIGAGFSGKIINYVEQTIGTGTPQVCGGVTFYPTNNGAETVNGQVVAQCVCMGW